MTGDTSTGRPPTDGPPGLPVTALDRHLRQAIPGLLQGPLSAQLVAGGRSNLTYLLTDGRTRWVLRRPPLGHVLQTAHDMGREHRLLAALSPTDVPVPAPLLLAGPDVIGAPFYIMEFADGQVLRDRAQLEQLDDAAATALADELVDVLLRLHRLDPEHVGLGDLGRPEGYLERQLRRWTRQLEASHSRDLPELTRLAERLRGQLPVSQANAIVHGDYRLDNVVVDTAGRGHILAVLDWEMATLGDPLADVASTLVWWDGVRGLDSPVAAVPADVPGYPGRGNRCFGHGPKRQERFRVPGPAERRRRRGDHRGLIDRGRDCLVKPSLQPPCAGPLPPGAVTQRDQCGQLERVR